VSELPQGWRECALEDISSDISYGYTAKSNPVTGDARMLRITDIQDNKVDWPLVPFCEISDSDKEKYLLRKWDLVFARTGATVGKSFLIRDDAPNSVFASYLIRVRSADNEMASYLSRFFDSQAYWRQITEFSAGIGQPNVNGSKLKSLRVPIAPLPEQKRIADKLDAVLARVDACRDRLDRIPAILKRFRQSVLAAAISGKLTEEWRGENGKFIKSWLSTIPDDGVPLPDKYNRLGKIAFKLTKVEHSAGELPNAWSLLTIADLYKSHALIDFADGNHGGMYPRKEDFTGDGALFLTATQIGENWEIDIHACPRLRNDKAQQLVKGWAKKNDVLLTHNATVGRVALLEYGEEDVLLGTSVTFYRFNEKFVSPNFARILFSSPFFQDQLQIEMSQTTRNQVPITKQVSLNFICPPIEEQTEIVRRVESLFAFANRLEARYTAARAQVEKLTPATLAKAFRGELVPQDPNDKPASELLERIKAQHCIKPARKPKESRKVAA